MDRTLATGIYRISDGSMVTHVEVGSESELRASRCLATGVRDIRPDAIPATNATLRYLEERPARTEPQASWVIKVAHFETAGDGSPGFNLVLCLEGPDGIFNHLDISLGIAGEADAPGLIEGSGAIHFPSVLWNKREVVNGVLLHFKRPKAVADFFGGLAGHLLDLAESLTASNEKPDASHGAKVND